MSTGKNKQSDWQKHKYGSLDYYKYMCEQYQEIIQNGNERGLKLDEIPRLLTVKTVKPKELEKTKNIRITNVHGSMEAKDILSKVEEIEKEKQKKDQLRDEKQQQKNSETEVFLDVRKGVSAMVSVKLKD